MARTEGWIKNLKMEPILRERLKNEMRRIRQRIDEEKDRTKKAKMIKAYRKMSETLIWNARTFFALIISNMELGFINDNWCKVSYENKRVNRCRKN